MVRAMNDVAHAMGKQTVAEYVESKECLDKLKEIGVDFVQGFYIGKPGAINLTHPIRSSTPVKLVTA
jgi:EAL domain-containing protein (putative c-di-GMP-specific phosphodiesterase class I)